VHAGSFIKTFEAEISSVNGALYKSACLSWHSSKDLEDFLGAQFHSDVNKDLGERSRHLAFKVTLTNCDKISTVSQTACHY